MRRASFAAFIVLALAASSPRIPVASAAQTFKVIVHPDVEGSRISRKILSSVFLKEVARWGSGQHVRPVDQSMRSPVRAAFSEEVLKTTVDAISSYWRDKIFKGVVPPPVKQTDTDIISYVASTKGAIGYVSIGTPLPDTVKMVTVID